MPLPDERMDASSDSAVSSMGSERVASLSDGGEWMETGSNSSQAPGPDAHYSLDYAAKYRMQYDAGYSGSTPMEASARKKYKFYGKRSIQDSPLAATPHHHQHHQHHQHQHHSQHPSQQHHQSKYSDYSQAESAQGIGAPPPGQAYSGPIEGAAGPKLKYPYVGLESYVTPSRSAAEQVQHNHTYNMPPETGAHSQRSLSREKRASRSSRSESEESHQTRDEKRARALNVPIAVCDIINLPMDEFNERLSKYDLSETQLSLIRDIRRRGKNKVAAQNCRKRKLDQIITLADEVKMMRDRKMSLISQRNYLTQERARIREKFSQLYRHISQVHCH